MAKVEAEKVLIIPNPPPVFTPTPSYRRVQGPVRSEAYADTPLIKDDDASLKLEIENSIVHEMAKALYGSQILLQSIVVRGKSYKINYRLIQVPKAVINVSAWYEGKKVAEVSTY